MREIDANAVTATIARLCMEANYFLPADVLGALEKAVQNEPSPAGQEVLRQLLENARIAREEQVPLCQDCGIAIVHLEVGQEVRIVGGDLRAAAEEGVRWGYRDGYLRKSVVSPPLFSRTNTRDNTPPVVHMDIVPGDRLKVAVAPKGAGSENMSALAMLRPADGVEGVIDFVVRTVERAGPNPCPPVVVGVGIGGTAEKAMLLAKRALLRPLGVHHTDSRFAELEKELLQRINRLGIGPAGFGGLTTALAVHVETYPTHMACLPVGVNLQCHAARHKEAVL